MPTVSIIVPNYNHARFLPRRLESIFNQTYEDFEIVLLDDCSTDDSRKIISQYASHPRIQIDFNQANSGSPFKQWNKGVRLAQGTYIWIAESDDYADEHLLERLVPILDSDSAMAFVCCRSWRVSDDDVLGGFANDYLTQLDPQKWSHNFSTDGRQICQDYFPIGNPIPNASAVVLRKSAYEQVGGADESFRLCGDWQLWAAMALSGHIGYIAEPLNYFRFHDASIRAASGRAGNDALEYLRATHWILDRTKPPEKVLEKMRRIRAEMWVPVLMSLHVPLREKRAIRRELLSIDPHPFRSFLSPALSAAQRKLARHWRDLLSMITPARI